MTVERFRKIFKGLETAYGQYVNKVTTLPGEKAKGKAFIKKDLVTDNQWKDHLEGKDPALGIIPINAESQCRWGCIDIDQYNFDHVVFINKIRKKKCQWNCIQ